MQVNRFTVRVFNGVLKRDVGYMDFGESYNMACIKKYVSDWKREVFNFLFLNLLNNN